MSSKWTESLYTKEKKKVLFSFLRRQGHIEDLKIKPQGEEATLLERRTCLGTP